MKHIDEDGLLNIANKYTGKCPDHKKVQKLGEEVVELAMAIASDDKINQIEELGDCLFILLDLKDRLCPDYTINDLIEMAAQKMVTRDRYIG